MVQGVINIPLIEDQLAIRAVAYRFNNDGFIENVGGSQPTPEIISAETRGGFEAVDRNAGEDEYAGLRLSALWRPVDNLSATLLYTNQEITQDGLREVDLNLPNDFQQSRLGVNADGEAEGLTNDAEIANLVVEYDVGWGTLFSSTSNIDYGARSEFSLFYIPFWGPSATSGKLDSDIFTEELRFTSSFEGPLQFLLGYFYENNDRSTSLLLDWAGDTPSEVPRLLFEESEEIKQRAMFGELTYEIANRWVATLGFRAFEYDQARPVHRLNGAVREATQGQRGEFDDTNYRVNLSYNLGDDILIYGQWAEGFRLGNFQTPINALDDVDGDGLILFADGVLRRVREGITAPDTTETFELGLKATLMDDRIRLNAGVFRINWENMPITLTSDGDTESGNVFHFNAGRATSQGVELEIQMVLTDQLIAHATASYAETVLAEDTESIGSKGDNLPGSADVTLALGLEYQFSVAGYDSFIRADYNYVDEFYHNIDEEGQASGGYGLLNLKVGAALGNIDISLFVNNLTNADEYTWLDNSFSAVSRAYKLKPRTIGLNLAYAF